MSPTALLQSPIVPTIARLAAPNLIAMFFMLATSAAEVWYVGQLGMQPLAGLALAFPMFMLMTMLSAGAMGGAVAGAVAQALGAGDRGLAEALAVHAILIAVTVGGLFAALFLGMGEQIYSLLGGKGDVLHQALEYSDLVFAGCISIWLINFLTSITRGCGHMRLSALTLIMVSAMQVGFGALLIIGAGPVEPMGIAGAGLAIVLSASLGSLFLLFWLISGRASIRLHVSGIPISLAHFKHLLKTGLLASGSPLTSVAAALVITALVARLGPEVLAGYGIGVRLEFLLIPVAFGIGAALITMVGVHFGAGQFDRGHRVAWIGGAGSAVITGGIGLFMAAFPDLWANRFTDIEAVREACRLYLRIVGPSYAFFGLGLSLYFASQGARRLFWPVAAGFIRFGVVALGGALIVWFHTPTEYTVFAVVAIGMFVYGTTIATSIRMGAWR